MTPQARVAAACEILDTIIDGAPAEKALTSWARAHRFAGSGDRAAIRDLVFSALRRRRSLAYLGGSETGRGLMIGHARSNGTDPAIVFTGEGYAPAPLDAIEANPPPSLADAPVPLRLDCPDWLWPLMQTSLGPDAQTILQHLQDRAPVFLRVNTARADLDAVIASLAGEDIAAVPHPLSPTALEVTRNPRRIKNSTAFREGHIELQDAASQAVVDLVLPYVAQKSVLDYCAGGGGKALALAAGGARRVVAHDANPTRMNDLTARAERAGVLIETTTEPTGVFDAVLCDAPCSGSGAWRRQPEAKWRLTPADLDDLTKTQDGILDQAHTHVADDGILAYATCSLFQTENEDRVTAFLKRHPDWKCLMQKRFSPLDGGDGFFVAILGRAASV